MRMLCFGDSNTFGYDPGSCFGGRYPAEDRWVDILAKKTGWDVVNWGENGREIPRHPHALEQAAQWLNRNSPDVAVVMLGTNDLLEGASVAETGARMEKLIRQIKRSDRCVILIAPPPVKLGAWVPDMELVRASAELAEAYRLLADRLEIAFADAALWDVELAFDGVHFTESGHRNFAEGLYDRLIQWGEGHC